jgi:ribosomal protein S18 acetylase RimI-like enzyme
VTIRAATHADIGAVLALWTAARSASASTPDDAASVAGAVDEQALLVAESDGGEIVGALIAAWDGWRGNMYRLTVAPAHRRKGIASTLVAAGEQRLRDRGARRITALVGGEDPQALALWRAVGYAHDEAIARFVKNL